MAMSQLPKDNIVISKQATTVTCCMERSQASSAQRSESPEAKFLKFCLLIKNVRSERSVAGAVEAIQSVCVSAACIGALVRTSGDGPFPCSEEREWQLPSSTSSCYLLLVSNSIQIKFLLPPIYFQQDLLCQQEGTGLH